jgi:hypothetical protein
VILDVHRPDDLEVPEAYERIRALSPAARFIVTLGAHGFPGTGGLSERPIRSLFREALYGELLMNKIESLHA